MWRSGEYRVEFLPKVKIEVVVLDEDLGKTFNTIVTKARIGRRGDGRVFVIPVENAIRIRTGDRDDNTV